MILTLPNRSLQAGASAAVPETSSLQLASGVLSQLNLAPDDLPEAG